MKFRIKPFLFSKTEFIFHEFYLKNLSKGWENPYLVTFERYNEKDHKELEKVLKDIGTEDRFFDIEEVRSRLDEGHRFYVAKKTDDIIGFFWIAINSFTSPYFHGTIFLEKDEALTCNAVIKKEFRGKGILNMLKAYAFSDLKKNGYKRVVGFYVSKNRASKRMNEKFGSIIIGKVYFYIIMTFAFRYHDLLNDKIMFHDNKLLFWRRLKRKVERIKQSKKLQSLR